MVERCPRDDDFPARSGSAEPDAELVFTDPYIHYGRLREEDPVHWSDELRSWVVTRYEDINWLVRHPELFSSEFYRRDPYPNVPPLAPEHHPDFEAVRAHRMRELIQNDPPEHTRMRKVLSRAFSPGRLEEWRPTIRGVVSGLLDPIAERGRADIVRDLGEPLPLLVISELLGVPERDRLTLKAHADERMASALSTQPDRMKRSADGIRATSAYLEPLIDERQGRPERDLLGLLGQAETERVLSRGEVLANAQMLIDAGHETTIQLLCNGVLAFLRNPEQWEIFRTDPRGLATQATEECLRYDPPLPTIKRIVGQDMELQGKSLKAGDRLLWVIAVANRDPRQFEDPDRFDILRSPNKHLSFGSGIHLCLGQYLARIEGQEVFAGLAERFSRILLKETELSYGKHLGVRSLQSLPVALEDA